MAALLDEDMHCMKKDWEYLVSVSPRFMGTAGERDSIHYLVDQIKKAGLNPVLQTFSYEGWQINRPAELFVEAPVAMDDVIFYASAAAALSVTRLGTSSSYPDFEEVMTFVSEHSIEESRLL